MKKTLAILFACLSISAFAARTVHSWFDMNIDQIGNNVSFVWPTDGTNYVAHQCYVTNTLNATFTPGTDYLAVGTSGPLLTFPYNSAPINDDNYATFSIESKFSPYKEEALPVLRSDICAGVIAVDSGDVTNFWVTAGFATPCWSNTLIAVGAESKTNVTLAVSNDVHGVTYCDWSFGSVHFSYPAVTLDELAGVVFVGMGNVSACYGDSVSIGEQVAFRLINGLDYENHEIALPADVMVSITNSYGTVIAMTADEDYVYSKGKHVYITYTLLTNGWVFCDTGSNQRTEVFTVTEGAHVVLDGAEMPYGLGIMDTDYGVTNGWLVLGGKEEYPYVGVSMRVDNVADAVGMLDSMTSMKACYSETPHSYSLESGGKSMEIDGYECSAPERRHYYQQDGSVGVAIDDCEFAITSFCENPTNSSEVIVGSVANSYTGFDYYLVWGGDVNFWGEDVEYDWQHACQGTGSKLELSAPKGETGTRFYKLYIYEHYDNSEGPENQEQ